MHTRITFGVIVALALLSPAAMAGEMSTRPTRVLRTFAEGNPVAIAWMTNEIVAKLPKLAVLDSAAATLSLYSADGSLVKRIAGPEELSSPQGLDVDPSGNIYVADTGNRRVVVFAADGSSRTLEIPDLLEPVDVAKASLDDYLLVVDASGSLVIASAKGTGRLRRIAAESPRYATYSYYDGFVVSGPDGAIHTLVPSVSPLSLTPLAASARLQAGGVTRPGRILRRDKIYIADRDRPRLVELDARWQVRGAISLDAPAEAMVEGFGVPSIYVADGRRVVQLGFDARAAAAAGGDDSPLAAFEALRAALERGDVDAALEHIHPMQRERYRKIYDSLGARLPAAARAMKNVTPYEIDGDRAELMLTRIDDDGAKLSFPVLCVRTRDGWKIYQY